MCGRLRAALKAGGVTLLLGLLCAATVAAPGLAATDFSHTHPHGTAPHLHPLGPLLGGVVPAPEVTVSLVRSVGHAHDLPERLWLPTAVKTQHHSRAPPA